MDRDRCARWLTSLLLLCTCACPAPRREPSGPATPVGPEASRPPSPATQPGAAERTPLVDHADPAYGRVEGDGLQNACKADGECFVGGCAGEICSAEPGASSICDEPAGRFPSAGGQCGCVAGECLWYRGTGDHGGAPATTPTPTPTPAPTPAPAAPGQAEACPDGHCQDGLTCVAYYGVAGTRGPKFSSCEVRCDKDKACPRSQRCVVIADGPGQVCRP